jgi:hypothetical protein
MQGQFIFRILTATSFLISSARSLGQGNETDTLFYRSALSSTIHYYTESVGYQLGLYNAACYPGYPFIFIKDNPYFQSDHFKPGSVFYDGILYTDVPLLYDQVEDAVIVQGNQCPIQLINKKLSGFTLNDHLFIWCDRNDVNDVKIQEGFYELLSKGRTGVLKREIKNLTKNLSESEGAERSVLVRTLYFIKINNRIYPINKTKDLIRSLMDKQNEIRMFIRNDKLKFRQDPETVLLRTTSFYDELIR